MGRDQPPSPSHWDACSKGLRFHPLGLGGRLGWHLQLIQVGLGLFLKPLQLESLSRPICALCTGAMLCIMKAILWMAGLVIKSGDGATASGKPV